MPAPRRVRKKGLIRRYAGPGVASFLMAPGIAPERSGPEPKDA